MVNLKQMQELLVDLATQPYPIFIGQGLLLNSDLLRRHVSSSQVLVITNHTVAPLYLERIVSAFSDKQCDTVILDDGEQYKNQQSFCQVIDTLIEKKHHRDTTIIALGGGVIGDIAGFVASTYQRGVNFLQIPTTLLAQVDSSVGGKTAINHSQGKNMIGSFYQPSAVIIDTDTLQSLPDREFNAGLGEIIKYAILIGGDFMQRIQKALELGLSKYHSVELLNIIMACCQIKATIVQQDEREHGIRALLNLGHTVGHALESYTHYAKWLHGEAVSIGLYCAALLSQDVCGFEPEFVQKIDYLLRLANLPRRIPSTINLNELIVLMNNDKKIQHNTLRFVLIKSIGNCYLESKASMTSLRMMLEHATEKE